MQFSSHFAQRSAHWLLFSIACLLCLTYQTEATTFQKEKRANITNLHHIDDDLFIWSQKYIQDGIINGDLFSGSAEIYLNGEVTGSANLFGNVIDYRGKTDGSLRCMGNTVTITGSVQKSLLVFSNKVSVDRSAVIARDVDIFAGTASFEGNCLGDFAASGDDISLGGTIEGNVELKGGHISFTPPTVIKGNLVIITKEDIKIDTASGITIGGTVTIKPPEKKEEEKEAFGFSDIMFMISKLLAAFLFGLLLIRFFRRHADQAVTQLRFHFTQSLAVGVLTGIIVVLVGLVLVVSILMSLLGLILISSDAASAGAVIMSLSILLIPITSFATVSGGVLFYIGKIIVGLALGFWIASKLSSKRKQPVSASHLFLGLLALSICFMVPIAGWLLYMFVSIIGIGAIVLAVKETRPTIEPGRTEPPLPTPPSSPLP